MYLHDFQHKLRQLNEKLYVKTDQVRKDGVHKIAGIYLKSAGRVQVNAGSNKGYASVEQQKYLEALERGELDKFICGITLDLIPEYDIIDVERSRIIAPGWRTILLSLIRQNVVNSDKAKKIFSCSSLGEADFDRATFFQKIQIIKERNENA